MASTWDVLNEPATAVRPATVPMPTARPAEYITGLMMHYGWGPGACVCRGAGGSEPRSSGAAGKLQPQPQPQPCSNPESARACCAAARRLAEEAARCGPPTAVQPQRCVILIVAGALSLQLLARPTDSRKHCITASCSAPMCALAHTMTTRRCQRLSAGADCCKPHLNLCTRCTEAFGCTQAHSSQMLLCHAGLCSRSACTRFCYAGSSPRPSSPCGPDLKGCQRADSWPLSCNAGAYGSAAERLPTRAALAQQASTTLPCIQ